MTNLHTVIAAEKHVKSRAHGHVSELYKLLQKPQLFSGQIRTYQPKDDAGENLPSERQMIQADLKEILRTFREEMAAIIDITGQKDLGNQTAKASVVVDGVELLPELPVPTLLFLEKTLTDIRTFVGKVPELDGSEVWAYDPDTGTHRSMTTRTHRTKKNQRAVVLYPATDKHPAQTQMVVEDEVVGFWDTQKLSVAMPKTDKAKLLDRVDAVLHAVKEAREKANDTVVSAKAALGAKIFAYIFRE